MTNRISRTAAAIDHEQKSREREMFDSEFAPVASDPVWEKWDKVVRESPWFVDKSKRLR